MKYDSTLIGRELVLSKLEEATKLWATMLEESFKDAKCSYVDATDSCDKKMGDVINFWRSHLHNVESGSWKKLLENDDTFISNFKVLEKKLFSICFPLASCFMQISFHFFAKFV
jgi:hypothetical protein